MRIRVVAEFRRAGLMYAPQALGCGVSAKVEFGRFTLRDGHLLGRMLPAFDRVRAAARDRRRVRGGRGREGGEGHGGFGFRYCSWEHSGGRCARPPRMASMVMPSFAA
jgi:hypothetical protein